MRGENSTMCVERCPPYTRDLRNTSGVVRQAAAAAATEGLRVLTPASFRA